MKHVMLDLETMGNRPGCPIISIGAVEFDVNSGKLGSEFYAVVSLESGMDAGLTPDAGSIMWWMDQADEARAAFKAKAEGLGAVLRSFSQWWNGTGAEYVWAHGASFDVPIIEAAYRAAKVGEAPWKFWNSRCTRTLYDLGRTRIKRSAGTHHNALDDAKNQALAAITAFDNIRLGVKT